jgi:hypothetical protein
VTGAYVGFARIPATLFAIGVIASSLAHLCKLRGGGAAGDQAACILAHFPAAHPAVNTATVA